ncbi:MAG: gfo/Idh/MocA family oxidoreductase, partial [Planctomycetota bacterium]
PVAVDTRQIEKLAGIAADTNRFCLPAMCMRFWPGWTWLRDTIADKSLGQLRSLSLQRIGARPGWNGFYADASQSGGALVDLHVHDSDFVHFCLGRPAGVTSVGHVDALTTMYHYDDADLRVVAEGAWHHEGTDFRMRYLADFDAGTADFDIARDEPLQLARGGALTPVDLPGGNGYDGEIRHMIQAVAEGRSPDVTLADAIATHRLLDAERDSLERRVRVDLPRL